jgi:hypothetical protein
MVGIIERERGGWGEGRDHEKEMGVEEEKENFWWYKQDRVKSARERIVDCERQKDDTAGEEVGNNKIHRYENVRKTNSLSLQWSEGREMPAAAAEDHIS